VGVKYAGWAGKYAGTIRSYGAFVSLRLSPSGLLPLAVADSISRDGHGGKPTIAEDEIGTQRLNRSSNILRLGSRQKAMKADADERARLFA